MIKYKFLPVCILFLFVLTGCGKAPNVNTNIELTGKWELESVVHENVTMNKPTYRQGLYDISLTFKDRGELEATSANNYLTGFYETAQLNSIQMGGDGTEREETLLGDIFVSALPNVNLYELKATKLVLYYDHGNKLIFSRVGGLDENLTASR